MTRTQLTQSLAYWRAALDYARTRLAAARVAGDKALRAKWSARIIACKRMIARRERQIAALGPGKPKMIRLRAPMTQKFGPLGPTRPGVGHYTAGPRDQSDGHAVALATGYNAQHRAQGWGAMGYMLALCSSGSLLLARPTSWKGAHVAGENTGRIGIVVFGGPGQRMTDAQRATLEWLRQHGHTAAMPQSHRLPVGAMTGLLVHNDLGATACPGAYESDYKR